MDLLLVGPQGQQTALMSDAGGCSDQAVEGVELRFDDEALHIASQSQTLASTTYQPTDYDGDEDDEDVDEYPAPAPTPDPGGEPSNLSVFDGTNPNGTWRLFAYDDAGEFLTRIDGGWSLDIGWPDATEPSGSVLVNGGTARTNQRNVSLTLSATDASPGHRSGADAVEQRRHHLVALRPLRDGVALDVGRRQRCLVGLRAVQGRRRQQLGRRARHDRARHLGPEGHQDKTDRRRHRCRGRAPSSA